MPELPPLAALVGIDWADDHHDIALQLTGRATVADDRLAHTPDAIHQWVTALAARAGGRIGIAVETSRGPLVSALLEHEAVLLYPVNPRSLKRFRETFTPSGAKDDRPDAVLLLELLTKHRAKLTPWQPDDATTRALGRLVEHRRRLVDDGTQLVQRLTAVLKEYFPQALGWAGDDLTSPMACAFLAKWPTLAALQRARPATVRTFYQRHNCRRTAKLEARLAEIPTAVALTTDSAIIEPNVLLVRALVAQLAQLHTAIARLDAAIAERFAAHPDAALFQSLPGSGAALAPRLLVAFGTDRRRFTSATAIQEYSGIAPITKRSGQRQEVCRRWAAPVFLRQTFHEFARLSVRHCAWARAFYAEQRARGKGKHAAYRSLAFKWMRIIWRCWQDGVPYDDARYTASLRRCGSPLAQHLEYATAA